MSKNKNKFLKTIRQYIIQIIIFILLANSGIAFLIFSKAQNANCIYQNQINSDSRCLYIYHNEVYEKGTKSRPHQGIDCGTNVDAIIPSLHFSGGIQNDFNTAKIGSFCGANAPTQAPTEQPTQAPTQAPSQAPTQQPTQAPTQNTNQPTDKPTVTQKPTAKPTAKPSNAPAITAGPTIESLPTEVPATEPDISGNSFGEILGRPQDQQNLTDTEAIVTQSPIINEVVSTKDKFKPTSITKPVTYAAVVGFIGSIILLFIF